MMRYAENKDKEDGDSSSSSSSRAWGAELARASCAVLLVSSSREGAIPGTYSLGG